MWPGRARRAGSGGRSARRSQCRNRTDPSRVQQRRGGAVGIERGDQLSETAGGIGQEAAAVGADDLDLTEARHVPRDHQLERGSGRIGGTVQPVFDAGGTIPVEIVSARLAARIWFSETAVPIFPPSSRLESAKTSPVFTPSTRIPLLPPSAAKRSWCRRSLKQRLSAIIEPQSFHRYGAYQVLIQAHASIGANSDTI